MDASFPYKILNETVVKNFKPDESFCPIISSKRGNWEQYQHTILEHWVANILYKEQNHT